MQLVSTRPNCTLSQHFVVVVFHFFLSIFVFMPPLIFLVAVGVIEWNGSSICTHLNRIRLIFFLLLLIKEKLSRNPQFVAPFS